MLDLKPGRREKSRRLFSISRLLADYQLATISSFGACAIAGILPFAIYRFATGNTRAGLLDLGIVGFVCVAVAHAWVTGDNRRAGLFLAIVNSAGCLASSYLLGPPGLFWMYPALLANFLLLSPRLAALFSVTALTVLTVQGRAYESQAQLAMFLVSAAVSSLIAYVFAARAQKQRKELEALASHDSLTGCLNRRAMVLELQIAVEQYRRHGSSVCLAMLDLDHFKRINDEHGHEAGDEVLVSFAQLLRRASRRVDRCFRFGGEEFVLLLPDTDHDALLTLVSGLRGRVAENLHYRGLPVTVSIGAAALRPGEEWQAWLSRADGALYSAKEAGRDCSVIDGEAGRDTDSSFN